MKLLCPLLVAAGSVILAVSAHYNTAALENYVADLEVEEFPEASHWLLHERPEEVAASVRAFAAGL